jgi:MipA family protein
MRQLSLAFALSLALAPMAVAAQEAEPQPAPPAAQDGPGIFAGDNATIGLGVAYRTSYEGSDDYIFTPAPLLRGTVGGVDFEARGPGLSFDLIADAPNARVKFLAGPQFRVNLNRTSQIKDPVVRLLGEHDAAIEGGGFVGVSFTGLTNPFDSLTLRVDALTDLGDVHQGTLLSPSVSYATPLSPAVFVVASVSATHADGNYTRSEFGVTAAGATASGLPVFTPSGGWKDVGANLILAYDLSGDVRDGGWSLFGLTSYSRLLEDAARSPIVRLRGDRDQWFLAAGLAYTF